MDGTGRPMDGTGRPMDGTGRPMDVTGRPWTGETGYLSELYSGML